MRMWMVIALVGAGSYLLRVLPLLLIDRVQLSQRAEDRLGDAALAAVTALVVSAVLHVGDHSTVPAAVRWTALGCGAIAAAMGLSMARVALVGVAGMGVAALVAHL